MEKIKEAYLKGVAHSIELHAEIIKQSMQTIQQNSLQDMPLELVEHRFDEAAKSTREIQHILSELTLNIPNE